MRFKSLGEDGSHADQGQRSEAQVISLKLPIVAGRLFWLKMVVGTVLGMFLTSAIAFSHEPEKQDESKKDLKEEGSPSKSAPEIRTTTPEKAKRPLALLRIESTPTNANITINNKREPLRTPAEFTLLPGDYTVVLAFDCYTSASTTLHLAGDEKQTLNRQLQQLPTGLVIHTVPSGARIFVDGAQRNERTPATISGIDAGDRWITVELAGYCSQKMAVKVKCGETANVDFGALQRPTANLGITSNVKGASVWIDGADSGRKTPCSVELAWGAHKVRLIGPQGYQPEEKCVTVQDEESMRLYVSLTAESTAASPNDTASQPVGESHH